MSAEFDKSKDRLLWSADDVFRDEHNRLSVSIYAYGDNGKPKLQISRERADRGDWAFVKLGRMSLAEFSAVAKAAKLGFAAVESGATSPDQEPPNGWKA